MEEDESLKLDTNVNDDCIMSLSALVVVCYDGDYMNTAEPFRFFLLLWKIQSSE